MSKTSVVGLDTAKNVFQVHGVDGKGNITIRKRLRRAQVSDFFANFPACTIGLEATQGAHHWARVLETFGHTVRLIAPQFVKPYNVKGVLKIDQWGGVKADHSRVLGCDRDRVCGGSGAEACAARRAVCLGRSGRAFANWRVRRGGN
jgi:hypothetical protein